MVLLEFTMSPMNKGESVSAYVARSIDIIDRSGLPYQLTAMGTIVEGEWADVMAVVTACFERHERGLRPREHLDQDRLSEGAGRPAHGQG